MREIRHFVLLTLTVVAGLAMHAQDVNISKNALANFVANYSNPNYTEYGKIKVEDIDINAEAKTIGIYLNEPFSTQPFRPQLVQDIYGRVKQALGEQFADYSLSIYADGVRIEKLIPASHLEQPDSSRFYHKTMFRGNPWVTPMSLPYSITKGLAGRHLCLWQSHGKYYSFDNREWLWQRPRLFCTTEDLFTQTLVVPYIMPMLENAGAIVYTPRERDWQKHEVIVDNDDREHDSDYEEHNGKYEWKTGGQGFAHLREYYLRDQDPFADGTYREVEAITGKRNLSSIIWTPNIPADGDYAVYVSYKTVPTSVSDAIYTVKHEGISTSFRVNQQMGGGTWVYLGTFHFTAGKDDYNCITLSNQSNYRGTITADAIRLGGGMGNIAMADSTMTEAIASGLPRCLEAARYSAQWNGLTQNVYELRGLDDYSNDIIARPAAENYLARGSVYLPGDSGLNVPLELSMAVHSDAGIRKDNTFVGMLGIYTTDWNMGETTAGLSRLTSRDLADNVLTQIKDDITAYFGTWTRRQMYDRNYGETREPHFPAIILETLSHQNWADMRMGHDPYFKFIYARAVYKGIMRYLNTVHQQKDWVVQPLPVKDLSVVLDDDKATLSWNPQVDPIEPSAEPTKYIIYTSMGSDGFDNGEIVDASRTSYRMELEPGVLYRFRVAAINEGGRSMMSDEVCAFYNGKDVPSILIADGFQRVAAPYSFDTEKQQGFDMNIDPGVIDGKAPCYCGNQLYFNKDGYGKETPDGLGYSGRELEGMILAGNTHNYATLHAQDIIRMGRYNISSCSTSALPELKLKDFGMIDMAMGAQKDDGYSLRHYKTFTPEVQQALRHYTAEGGNILVSGAYIASDMQSSDDRQFTSGVLKYQAASEMILDSIQGGIQGFDQQFSIWHQPNEEHYWIKRSDVLQPAVGAFSSMIYDGSSSPAAIAYKGNDYHVMAFGFPLECIQDAQKRRLIFGTAVRFLLEK